MNELRKRRKELGLTQKQMAKAVGVSRRTYQTYEGECFPNDTYEEILKKLKEFGCFDGRLNYVLNIKTIKARCKHIFAKYPEVKCAYLYGSYARDEATADSDVDIMVVCHGMGMSFFRMAGELEEALNKEVDLQTLNQFVDSETLLENAFVEGIKIYGKLPDSRKD